MIAAQEHPLEEQSLQAIEHPLEEQSFQAIEHGAGGSPWYRHSSLWRYLSRL